MANILANVAGGKAMMAFWYHFAILFEALFILTAVDAGTRAGRFMLQDLLGAFVPALKRTESLPANLLATGLCVACWGYFLYQGVVDPLGGINTLWPLFGIANQMLAGIALILATAVLFKMKRGAYAWVTIVPTIWLLLCTLVAGWQKIFDANVKVGFLAHAHKFQAAIDQGQVLAPAKSMAQMQRVVVNDYIDAALCGLFIFVVVAVLVYGVRTVLQARGTGKPTSKESPFVTAPVAAQVQ
jgi:carbon starvation protein